MAEEPGENPPTPEAPAVTEAAPEAPAYSAMDYRRLPDLAGVIEDPQIRKVLDVYPKLEHFVKDAVGWRSEMTRRTRIPTGETKPEDWQRFWQQLPGYPKDPKGYTEHVTLPELGTDVDGQALQWEPQLLEDFYTTIHTHGITTAGAQALLEMYARNQAQTKNVLEARAAQAVVDQELQLQQRFGGRLPSALGAARDYFLREMGGTELGERLYQKLGGVRPDHGPGLCGVLQPPAGTIWRAHGRAAQ